jgi:hypothetical protein
MATNKSNPTTTVQKAVPEYRRVSESRHEAWLKTLTEQPVLSPHFVIVLHDHISQAILDWLIANAPSELVTLHHCRSSMQTYYEEFEASNGFVSELTNMGFMDTVRDAINTLDKIGAGDFETMG